MRTGNYRKQLGFTAIELMVVLIVAVGALVWGGDSYNTYIDNLENQSAAQHASKVRDAAQKYIKDNNASIQAVATATVPASITIAMLQSTGNLDPSFGATNSFGQSYSIKVLQPTAGKLQALILTTGGSAIPELSIRRIAQLIGAQGGYVSSANTAVATGSYSTWSTPLPGNYGVSPGAGHLAVALFFADSGTVSDYLYRNAVPGRADLNTMNTPIIMSSVQTSGNACTDTGAIARDTNGAVLSCQGGTWKSQGSAYWQDSVANYASLPACTASIAWSTRVAQVPTVGTGPRAYTCDGFVWQPLGVDNSGNLLIPGALTVSGGATFNGAMTLGDAAADAITINGTVTANNGLTIGNGTAATASNTLVVNRTATEGGACSPNGAVARDAVGLILSCQSGVWAAASGGGGVTTSGGVAQLWKAVAGQTIGCAVSNWRADAMVDVNGVFYSRVRDFGWGGDSGWIAGALAYAPQDGSTFSQHTIARTTLGGVTLEFGTTTSNIVFKCEAKWV